jgi:hypothetical protein
MGKGLDYDVICVVGELLRCDYHSSDGVVLSHS